MCREMVWIELYPGAFVESVTLRGVEWSTTVSNNASASCAVVHVYGEADHATGV